MRIARALHGRAGMPLSRGRNHNLLYMGTEMGVWASWDRGTHWVSLRGDLPVTPVRDIQVHPRDNDLLLATHGRGLYIMDDVSALQNLSAAQSDRRHAVRHSSSHSLESVESRRQPGPEEMDG